MSRFRRRLAVMRAKPPTVHQALLSRETRRVFILPDATVPETDGRPAVLQAPNAYPTTATISREWLIDGLTQ